MTVQADEKMFWTESAMKVIDSEQWVAENFCGCELGDERRTRRLVKIAENMAKSQFKRDERLRILPRTRQAWRLPWPQARRRTRLANDMAWLPKTSIAT